MSISLIGTWFKCDRCGDGIYKDGLPKEARERIHAAGWKTERGHDYCPFCVQMRAAGVPVSQTGNVGGQHDR